MVSFSFGAFRFSKFLIFLKQLHPSIILIHLLFLGVVNKFKEKVVRALASNEHPYRSPELLLEILSQLTVYLFEAVYCLQNTLDYEYLF